jgi:hypothetical protein
VVSKHYETLCDDEDTHQERNSVSRQTHALPLELSGLHWRKIYYGGLLERTVWGDPGVIRPVLENFIANCYNVEELRLCIVDREHMEYFKNIILATLVALRVLILYPTYLGHDKQRQLHFVSELFKIHRKALKARLVETNFRNPCHPGSSKSKLATKGKDTNMRAQKGLRYVGIVQGDDVFVCKYEILPDFARERLIPRLQLGEVPIDGSKDSDMDIGPHDFSEGYRVIKMPIQEARDFVGIDEWAVG